MVQWARDNLEIVSNPKELDELAASVDDCGGVYIVPAFSGLFAPYWRSDARGIIAGLTVFGKAVGKNLAISQPEKIVFGASKIVSLFNKKS